MEPTITPDYSGEKEVITTQKSKSGFLLVCDPLCHVTTVSKVLAAVLFIILPFLGAWIGYQLAPVEVAVNVDDTMNIPQSQPAFSAEEVTQLRTIQAQNLANELREKIKQEEIKNVLSQATSTVIFSNLYEEQPCEVKIPEEKYSYGSTFGSFTLDENTRSCFGENIINTFKFTGTTTLQGVLVTDVMDGPFLEISSNEYLVKLPSKNNGIKEIDLMTTYQIYQKVYAPELKPLFEEAMNNSNKKYIVEVTITSLEFTLGAPKGGFSVNTHVIGEPKIISTVNKT